MKFIFKTGLMAWAILLSNCAFAWDYNYFYLGANIGAVSLIDKENTSVPSDNHDLSALGALAGGLVGVDFTLRDQYKLGIEGFANAVSVQIADNQNYTPVTTYNVSMSHNLGLRLLPGYEFTQGTLGHVILGYSSAKFDISDNGNYGLVSSSFRRNGFQFGLGLITNLVNNAFIRTDVLYTAYGSETSSGVTTTTPASTQNYRNNLSTLEGDLALVFNLC